MLLTRKSEGQAQAVNPLHRAVSALAGKTVDRRSFLKGAGLTAGTAAFVSRAVFTKMDEGDLRPLLDAIVERFPDVGVGSYPKWQDPLYKTKLTFDGRSAARVEEARDAFVALLPPGEPQPIEG